MGGHCPQRALSQWAPGADLDPCGSAGQWVTRSPFSPPLLPILSPHEKTPPQCNINQESHFWTAAEVLGERQLV